MAKNLKPAREKIPTAKVKDANVLKRFKKRANSKPPLRRLIP